MDLTEFFILAFATFRITNLIVDDGESGPWDVLDRLRYAIGVRYDDKSRRAVVAKPSWKRMLASMHNCFWCASVWYGIAVALVYWVLPADARWVWIALLSPFALSGAALVARSMAKK